MESINAGLARTGACIRGRVVRGTGLAAGFTELPWVREQIRRRLGFAPHPGTLNVRLGSPDALEAWQHLKAQSGIPLEPEPGSCAARCYPVLVDGRIEAAIVLPLVTGYPANVVELLAPVRLRDALDLADGAALTIVLSAEA
jgi:CTP-dependent riboflavin kinase